MRTKLTTYLTSAEQVDAWGRIKAIHASVPDAVILRNLIEGASVETDPNSLAEIRKVIDCLVAEMAIIKQQLGVSHGKMSELQS